LTLERRSQRRTSNRAPSRMATRRTSNDCEVAEERDDTDDTDDRDDTDGDV